MNNISEDEFLKDYDPDKYPKPAVTADICVIATNGSERELLLIKRGNHPYLGRWALPGGFAERNETLGETASRELKEETGIDGVSLELFGVYSKPGRDPRGWTISAAYKAHVLKGSVKAKAGDDADDAKWFIIEQEQDMIQLHSGGIVLTVIPDKSDLAFDHADIIKDCLCS